MFGMKNEHIIVNVDVEGDLSVWPRKRNVTVNVYVQRMYEFDQKNENVTENVYMERVVSVWIRERECNSKCLCRGGG